MCGTDVASLLVLEIGIIQILGSFSFPTHSLAGSQKQEEKKMPHYSIQL